ncbi:MAG: DNA translocase FtsK 4TM domain-containing protein [Candidatus Hydrogenedentes bacterium]|nr:DNA translocase FtsK 4TM domain-containing protein [Candidatus Hydrogenedentota bacterium]
MSADKTDKKVHAARRDEIVGIVLLAVAVAIILSIVTYHVPPQGSDGQYVAHNAFGPVGAAMAGGMRQITGLAPLGIAFVLGLWGVRMVVHRSPGLWPMRIGGAVLVLLVLSALLERYASGGQTDGLGRGGLVGAYLADRMTAYFGFIGTGVVLVALLLISLLLVSDFLLLPIIVRSGAALAVAWRFVRSLWQPRAVRIPKHLSQTAAAAVDGAKQEPSQEERQLKIVLGPERDEANNKTEKTPGTGDTTVAPAPEPVIPKLDARRKKGLPYVKPPLSILIEPVRVNHPEMSRDLRAVSALLEETLEQFGVEASVVQVTRGPVITRYELEPAPGVKVTRFTSLSDDIALALKAHRVRVEAPIPGKGRIGIEVPNEKREPVVLKDCLMSESFRSMTSPVAVALGKDVAGDPMVVDLATLPHLLIAGATGSGKTICVKTILSSLLFNATPNEVELMLIDPKMVELSIYNGIPHLIAPVITDAKKAPLALEWLTEEMERRYKLLARLGIRNVQVYNEQIKKGLLTTEQIQEAIDDIMPLVNAQEQSIGHMSYIVVIIDEMADLMALCRAEIENAITRLAQLARAVGIHLIVATQRPSVDVLTGVIKNNFPARISFKVASKFDSRTILDGIGAEQLTGRGDMLMLKAGDPKPVRAQGSFISDEETADLIEFLRAHGEKHYRSELLDISDVSVNTVKTTVHKKDDLYDEAIQIVRDTGQASITMLQRRLRIGYARAANIIDTMEQEGIVGPPQGSKPREILI